MNYRTEYAGANDPLKTNYTATFNDGRCVPVGNFDGFSQVLLVRIDARIL